MAYFLSSTLTVAAVVALTESKNLRKLWHEYYFWSFPYCLVGGTIAALISNWSRQFRWETTALGVRVVYVIFRSYRLYVGRFASEKSHAEEMVVLHMRTIEALALAIEAKDHTTHDHLQRVQIYALALGKKMGLDAGISKLGAPGLMCPETQAVETQRVIWNCTLPRGNCTARLVRVRRPRTRPQLAICQYLTVK